MEDNKIKTEIEEVDYISTIDSFTDEQPIKLENFASSDTIWCKPGISVEQLEYSCEVLPTADLLDNESPAMHLQCEGKVVNFYDNSAYYTCQLMTSRQISVKIFLSSTLQGSRNIKS
jgi:hypothetical protein